MEKRNHVILGLLGAIIGAVIGAALWVAIGLFGFIAGIAGMVIIILATKGYKLLAGTLDKKGIVFSIIISVVAIVAANVVTYLIAMYQGFSKSYEVDIAKLVQQFIPIMSELKMWGSFAKDLIIGLALTGWASYTMIRKMMKEQSGTFLPEQDQINE